MLKQLLDMKSNKISVLQTTGKDTLLRHLALIYFYPECIYMVGLGRSRLCMCFTE